MDDFGSKYSSLNMLQTFRFDKIKLDMAFMRNFTEVSKKIVRSILMMAREMGISTLAEGVETQEQYDFLSSVGCDNIQGYLIGKPMPASDFNEVLKEVSSLERRRDCIFYNNLSYVDFLTDKNLAVLEFDGADFRILYSNEAFAAEWQTLHLGPAGEFVNYLNHANSPTKRNFLALVNSTIKQSGFHEADMPAGDSLIRLRIKCISSQQVRHLFQVELSNITQLTDGHQNSDSALVYNTLLNMHDTIIIADLSDDSIKEITNGTFNSISDEEGFSRLSCEEAIKIAANKLVHHDDRAGFLAFFNTKDLKQRTLDSQRGFLTAYFRTKSDNGSYSWKLHYLANVPDTDRYLYFTKIAPLQHVSTGEESLLLDEGADAQVTSSAVWNALMETHAVNLFWKDKERRFVGANQQFLDTYGFESIDDIIGKTDEDMLWHVSDAAFRQDEEEVLKNGTCIRNHIGKCVVRGVTYDILVNKGPVYQDNAIVGLWGQFVILENIAVREGEDHSLGIIDPVTKLQSARGILPIAINYIDEYEANNTDFAIVTLGLPNYQSLKDAYGQDFTNEVLSAIGDILIEEVGVKGSCANLYSGIFAIYGRFNQRSEILDMTNEIQQRIAGIHQIGSMPVTLRPTSSVFFASDSEDLQDLLWRSLFLSIFNQLEDLSGKFRRRESDIRVLDNLPCMTAVFNCAADGSFSIVHINEKAHKFIDYVDVANISLEQMLQVVHPDDLDRIRGKFLALYPSYNDFDERYRVRDAQGNVEWIHHFMKADPKDDGSCAYYSIYTDITEEKQAEVQYDSAVAQILGHHLSNGIYSDNLDGLQTLARFQGSIIENVSKAYQSVHIVNIQNDCYYLISCDEELARQLPALESAQETLDHIASTLIHADSYEQMGRFLDLSSLTRRIHHKDFISCRFKDINDSWHRCTFIPVSKDGKGNLKEVLFIVEHIRHEKETERRLTEESRIDGISQLLNHSSGEKEINRRLMLGESGVFMMFDIDDFKQINDTYGHVAGDKLLKNVGKLMRENFREDDILVRLGGDEFGAFLPDTLSVETCEEIMSRFENSLEAIDIPEFSEQLSICYGCIAAREGEYSNFVELYQTADALMYEKKNEKKRNRLISNPFTAFDKMPGALFVFKADETEKILYASPMITELFDCASIQEFMALTKESYNFLVAPSDIARVKQEIHQQTLRSGDLNVSHVTFNIITAKGRVRSVEQYGQLTNSSQFGECYYAVLSEINDKNSALQITDDELEPNNTMDRLMEYLGITLKADRAYIFEMNNDTAWDNTYEWCDKGVEPQIQNLQGIPVATTEIWNKQFALDKNVIITDLELTREDDPETYEYLAPQDIHSLVVGPIKRGGELIGFFGIDNPQIANLEDVSNMVGTISRIVTSSLEKRDAVNRLL